MTTEPPVAERWEQAHHDLLVAVLRSLAIALLVAAGTVAALAFIETWDGSPAFGLATYLFWPMLTGALTLLALASRSKGPQHPA